MVRVFRQEDGSYLIPMEMPEGKCSEEMETRRWMKESAKQNGYKIDWVKWGFRIFEAVLIPGTEEQYRIFSQEEAKNQKLIIREGRCMIGAEIGGVKRCPERIPNPRYGEPGEPKTIYNDCASCPFNKDGHGGHVASLSHSGNFDEDGEELDMEIPVGIATDGYLYELYCDKIMEFVREKYPKCEGFMGLLLQGMDQTEASKQLGIARKTIYNNLKKMKADLTAFIDSIIIFE